MENKKEKTIIFGISKKGGVGKSSLAYCMGHYFRTKEYFHQVAFFDADTERMNPSSMRQLQNILPSDQLRPLTFTDSRGRFSREKIEEFIESFGRSAKRDLVFVDLGSKTSDNLVEYLKDPECLEALKVLLQYYNIKLKFMCLLAGNMLDDTAPDIEDIFETIQSIECKKIIVNNKYLSANETLEKAAIKALEKKYRAETIDFQYLSSSASEDTISHLFTLIRSGVDIYKEGNIDELPFPEKSNDQEKLLIRTANETIRNFWNAGISTRIKVKMNFEHFSKRLDEIL